MTEYELVEKILKLIAKEPWARMLLVQASLRTEASLYGCNREKAAENLARVYARIADCTRIADHNSRN